MDYLVIGGDARQDALAKLLAERFAVAVLEPKEPPEADWESVRNIVLPIPSCWPDGMPRGVRWEDLEPYLAEGVTVYGGAMGALGAQLVPYGVRCVDLLRDAEAVVQNARLTAEAALLLVMRHTGESLHALPCSVIGYGRIGRLLSARLAALGAQVRVVSATPEKRALAEAEGFSALAPEDAALKASRIIFNTAPAQLIPAETLSSLPETVLWVELASPPTGLPAGERFAFSRLSAGGLPAKLLPVSAADVLYRAILKDRNRITERK